MSGVRALVVGCGYVGLRLVRALRAYGVAVAGTTRSTARFAEIRAAGAEPLRLDVLHAAELEVIREWRPDVVFDLVRPQPLGADEYSDAGTRNLVELLCTLPLQAAVYVGSTAVYGRREGQWTDEQTLAEPSSPLGHARLRAETLYLEAWRARGLPARVARVPGIYGPGRTLRQRLESGAYRRVDDESLWVSRIHVADLADGLVSVWRNGRAGEVYLLCDDQPVTGSEYVELTANLLSLPLPPAVSRDDIRQESTTSDFERRVAARRCSNRRMREELQVRLRYPTVHVGLPAALREEGAI